jgi:hypothetical protein
MSYSKWVESRNFLCELGPDCFRKSFESAEKGEHQVAQAKKSFDLPLQDFHLFVLIYRFF